MNTQPETFWAWLAGFIDGDGTVGLYKDSQGYAVAKIVISQKDRTILDRITEDVGSGSVHKMNGTWGDVHQLAWGSGASKKIAAKLLPYLRVPKKLAKARVLVNLAAKTYSNAVDERPEFQKAATLYANGMSCKDIGAQLNTKAATINYWLRSRGLTRTYQQSQQIRRRREAV